MIYDIIIIGAGPAGLFTAANVEKKTNSLILNNTGSPGKKLLISGAGQCNITNTGKIKDFLSRYGDNGIKIRKALYGFSNISLINYLENKGINCFRREDGKVFPSSMNGRDLLELLLNRLKNNGFKLINDVEIRSVEYIEEKKIFQLRDDVDRTYKCLKLVVATGGLSYPKTGSNGMLTDSLKSIGLEIIPMKEALVPIYVENYPYSSLSGTSFKKAKVVIGKHQKTGSLLFTHKNLSGPVILDMSRYANSGETIRINYLGDVSREELMVKFNDRRPGCVKLARTIIYETLTKLSTDVTKRYVDLLCEIAGVGDKVRFAELKKDVLKKIVEMVCEDSYMITGNAGFNVAMCTTGGVSLDEIDVETFEVKKYPGMYVIGEALDVDGDTGGFNIQFAFTSGYVCAKHVLG